MIFRIQSILLSLALFNTLSFVILFSYYNGPSVVQSFAFQSFPGSYQASHLQSTAQTKIKFQGDNVLQSRRLLSLFGSYITKEAQKGKGSPNYFQSISRQSSLYSMNSDSDNMEENEQESVEASTTIPEQEQEVDQSPNDVEAEGTDENPVKEEPLESEKVNEVAKDTVLNSIAFLSKKCASLEAEIKSKNETINQLEAQYEDLEAEWGPSIRSMRDDFETLKERYLNDTLQYSADGKIKVFTEMITTLEDLERAERMNNAKGDNEKAIEKEYKAIADKMIEVMKAMGVEEVETVGKEFNYEYHDALFTEPSDEYPEEYITKELSKGFLLNGKCIRAAKVATSEGPGP